MSLHRRLVFLVTGVLLLLLTGVSYLYIQNSRDYLEQQLHTHAQDTATSLGLSLSSILAKQDSVLADAMMSAIFDRGDFQQIRLRNADGDVLLNKLKNPPQESTTGGAPKWFIAWLKVSAIPGISEITNDWKIVGEIRVVSDISQANNSLWASFKQAVWVFLWVGMISWVLIVVIVRTVLSPLRALEKQAEAICNKNFDVQQPVPKTAELRPVVQAINRMTRQLKVLFDEQVSQMEQVRKQAYVDPVTGLGNGRFFNAHLESRVSSRESPFCGVLIRLQINGLEQYNERFGHDAGNLLLSRLGQIWVDCFEDVEGGVVAKVTGARFTALLPGVSGEQVMLWASGGMMRMHALDSINQGGSDIAIYAGLSVCSLGGDVKQLEMEAAAALEQAQAYESGCIELYSEAVHGDTLLPKVPGITDWRAFLEQVVQTKHVVMHFQPVLPATGTRPLYFEMLPRIRVQEKLMTAGHFIPLLEREKMISQFDQIMLEMVIETLRQIESSARQSIAVNLSCSSIQSTSFTDVVLNILQHNQDLARYLIFEVPEIAVRTAHTELRKFVTVMDRSGIRFIVDHFGTTNSSFGYLSGIPLYAIKVDRSYIRGMTSSYDHQFFLQSLVRIAHSRQILLIAELVESEPQWRLLKEFQIDGGQGFFLGEPKAEIVLP